MVELLEAGAAAVVVLADGDEPSKELFEGCDAVVHAARGSFVAAVLDAAGGASVASVVVVSSAAVYGAWPDNAVPLTEEVSLRPNPGFAFAAEEAEGERRAAEWREDHPSTSVAILRLAPVLTPQARTPTGRRNGETWLSATVARPSLLRPADVLPPVQAIHVEDAAAAVVHALRRRLDGTFNVAPEGHVAGDVARALSAAGIPVALPERLAAFAERWAWRLHIGGTPPAAAPYRLHPWVIASDKLRATGWAPSYTAEEAIVACRKGSWWRELSPKRRQEVALGASGGVVALLAAAVVVAVRAARVRASRRA